MKRIIFITLIVGLTIAAFGSIFAVWTTGLLPRVGGGIVDSQRFSDVLKEEDMSAWIHGHHHSDHSVENVRGDRWETTFIDDGSIVDHPESLFLIFENGKRKVTVKSRNHGTSEWNENLKKKFSFSLDYNFDYAKDNLIVWIFSDIQPTKQKHWETLENSIEDVNRLNIKPDMALIPGDLVDHGAIKNYQKLKNYLDNSNIPVENFYELAGNHDFNPYLTGDHSNYQKIIENDLDYTVKRGNIMFILISDDKQGSTGVIDNESFKWWESTVKKHQTNTNLITLAHHPIKGTTRGSYTGITDFLENNLYFILPIIIPILISSIIAYETSS